MVIMLSFQEKLVQIGTLKDQGFFLKKIGESFDPPLAPGYVWKLYRRYIRPFSTSFHFIVKELNLDHLAQYEEECRSLFYFFLSHIKKRTKFRNVKLLTPIVSYFAFRLKGEIIPLSDFCQIFNISSSDFKIGVLLMNQLYLEHYPSNQDDFVLDLIDKMNAELSIEPIHEFYIESTKMFSVSNMDDLLDDFITFYHSIREKIGDNPKYKFIEVSGPIILYLFLKSKGILIPLPKFLEAYQLGYYEFTTNLKMIITRYYPEYIRRDKTSIVQKYIITIFKNLHHSDEELFATVFTLHRFFHPFLHHAKEEVIATVICVLTMITYDLSGITTYHICNEAGIRQSTLNKQFTRKIYPCLEIPDTLTLRKAFPLIKRKILKKVPLKKVAFNYYQTI